MKWIFLIAVAITLWTFTHGQSSNRCSTVHNQELSLDIQQLNAWIEATPTTIDESSAGHLKYTTPYFRATATVRIPPLGGTGSFQIGWVQACTDSNFTSTYGSKGYSSWEIPQLKTAGHSMISDSDGTSYPWYGSTTEFVSFTIPSQHSRDYNVYMDDNFSPSVSWAVPVGSQSGAELTHIRRTQGFNTWLILRIPVDGSIYILKTIQWSMNLEIAVDPSRPLGSRARLIGSGIQQAPQILNSNVGIPQCALEAPTANTAQTLLWYPAVCQPQVVVPPQQTHGRKRREE